MKKLLTVGLLTGALLVGSIGNAFAAEKTELKSENLIKVENLKDQGELQTMTFGEDIIIKASEIEPNGGNLVKIDVDDSKFTKINFDKNKLKNIIELKNAIIIGTSGFIIEK